MKLYTVEIAFKYHVLAESLDEAEQVAHANFSDAANDSEGFGLMNEHIDISTDVLGGGWEYAPPYCKRGANPESKDCAELFEELNR